jgi:hypothetical protein
MGSPNVGTPPCLSFRMVSVLATKCPKSHHRPEPASARFLVAANLNALDTWTHSSQSALSLWIMSSTT